MVGLTTLPIGYDLWLKAFEVVAGTASAPICAFVVSLSWDSMRRWREQRDARSRAIIAKFNARTARFDALTAKYKARGAALERERLARKRIAKKRR